ncbi:MAG: hypothetical protein ACI9UN_002246 [Granulosicoccus sp.]|jgi:hypothetical protein
MNISNIENRRAMPERRHYDLQTLKQCLTNPRRVDPRRTLDRKYPVIDRLDNGAVALAIALMVLSVMDSIFTLTIISHGGSEMNPVMNALLEKSVTAFAIAKMLLTAIPALILVATANLMVLSRWRTRSLLAATVGLYAGLICYELLLLSYV